MGAAASTRGAVFVAVAESFSGRALGAQVALVDGAVGVAWVVAGTTEVAWNFSYIDGETIVHIDMHADPSVLHTLAVEPLQ
jgi:hypothetical protein